MMPRVLVLGIAVLDHRFWVAAWPPAGGRTPARAYAEDLGGQGAVAAAAIARLGGAAVYAGSVGGDAAGTRVVGFLHSHDVDTRHMQVFPDGRTAVSSVAIAPGGERFITAYPGEGLPDGPDLAPIGAVTEAHAVLVDSRLPRAGTVLAAAARTRGLPVVVDFDADNPAVWALIQTATHVIADEEVATQHGGAQALLGRLRAHGVWGAVTLGAGGVRHAGGHQPAFQVAARDTTGAGDVFHGAFVLALAERQDPEGALRFASAAAALRCETGGLPDRRAVNELLSRSTVRG
ncbi:MAG TPA: PfkB family carbohydrate kinase [bacterium]|nr:PfkB family carbohydrate kinase [bacterium]